MRIDSDRIRELVPHAGSMCLLERVVDCSAQSIRCETRSHTAPTNPLRRDGHLSSICAIEYAAQAMALHRAIGAPPGAAAKPASSRPKQAPHGYLVSVRQVHCRVRYLDMITAALDVRADYVYGDASSMVYLFTVAAAETVLVTGRASVMLGRLRR